MKLLNNKGYLLIEVIAAACIGMMVLSVVSTILYDGLKNWGESEANLEMTYNLREAVNYLEDEVRDGSSVDILDSSTNGWIKVYKTADRSRFTTFRLKNNKLYVGFGNILNPNSEVSNFIKTFKVSYVPEGANLADKATGIKVIMEFERGKQRTETSAILAFRCRN